MNIIVLSVSINLKTLISKVLANPIFLIFQVEKAAKNLETKISHSLDYKWPYSNILSQCESVCEFFPSVFKWFIFIIVQSSLLRKQREKVVVYKGLNGFDRKLILLNYIEKK